MISQFFLDPNVDYGLHANHTSHAHDHVLVLLSIAIAVFASFTALILVRRVMASAPGATRRAWLATGAICMGGGVWSMHFTAMLAISLPHEVGYDVTLTAISAVFVILAAAATFHLISSKTQSYPIILLEGVVLGGGIGAMHYTGMAAMELNARILYDPVIFAASVGVAVILATLSVCLMAPKRLTTRKLSYRNFIVGATVMGGSVSTMHYTGMAATHFIPAPGLFELVPGILPSVLAIVIAAATGITLALALLASFFEGRIDDKNREAREAAELLTAVAKSTSNGIIAIDHNGAIMMFNPGAEAMFGYDKSEVMGNNVNMLVRAEERGSHDAYLENSDLHIGKVIGYSRSVIGVRKDGSEVPLEISLSTAERQDGKVFIGICHDISDRLAVEEQLRNSQKLEAVGQLAGGVAHDFNNLLMVIQGYGQRALDNAADNEHLLDAVKYILTASEKAAHLTKQLLVFSQRKVMEARLVRVADLLTESEDLLQPLIGERYNLVVEAPDPKVCISVDPGELTQAIMNLAINARDAMAAGGTIRIGAREFEADAAFLKEHEQFAAGEYVEIYVADDGSGIDEETLARIFEPFFTTKEQGKGTGLGLAMVHGFAVQSDGALGVDSALGEGTTFRLYLPRAEGTEVFTAEEVQDVPQGNGEMILLVEDDIPVRGLMEITLTDLGYSVLVAGDGIEAIEVEADHEGDIDLLLSDVVMPNMTGFEMAEIICPERPETKVVFMSGYPGGGDTESENIPEDSVFLAKPVNKFALAKIVHSLINGDGPPDTPNGDPGGGPEDTPDDEPSIAA